MMSCCPGLRILTVAAALAVATGLGAQAAALVGETRLVTVAQPVATVQDFDLIKAQYRRPDIISFPPGNPYTPEKAQLGRALFYDTRLSADAAISCASCHNPGFAFGDGRQRAMGSGMRLGERRSPSITDSAWGELFTWDGRAASLEQQAMGPITNPAEMALSAERLVRIVADIPGYRPLFGAAFPHEQLTAAIVVDALATYERTIVSGFASFDAWVEGDETAIPEAAKRGFILFTDKAGCSACHSDWTFTDYGFHDIGLPGADLGRGRLQPRVLEMQHAFKTPSLRDTARRGPYMHDGSLPNLEAVVAHYNQGGVSRPSRSALVHPLQLSPAEQADIIAFLQTLTSPAEPDFIPALPR